MKEVYCITCKYYDDLCDSCNHPSNKEIITKKDHIKK